MAVNSMQITDIYAILNSIHAQATGKSAIAVTNTSDFVSVAQSALTAGTDSVYNAMMDIVGKTLFAVRPYNRKFDITRNDMEYGAIVRKVSFGDKALQQASDAWAPVDGSTSDMYRINKAPVLETRFYGSAVYQDSDTTFEDQIKTAMSGPDQLGAFMTSKMTHLSNKWEQWLEEQNRATVANFIGAKNIVDANSVIHLLTEYNTLTGLNLSAQDVYQDVNVQPFFRWVRARINTLARMMGERSEMFQANPTGYDINRHTDPQDMRIYLRADALDIIDAMVNTVTYHDEPLAYADVRGVSYWQSIQSPDEINVTPSYADLSTGAAAVGAAQNIDDIFGIMFDKDAIASNVALYKVANTPLNPRGLYYNTWLNARLQYLNDQSEKAVVLLLD